MPNKMLTEQYLAGVQSIHGSHIESAPGFIYKGMTKRHRFYCRIHNKNFGRRGLDIYYREDMGCPDCQRHKKSLEKKQLFEKRIQNKHGEHISVHSDHEYFKMDEKILLHCSIHDQIFKQNGKVLVHYRGPGCKGCRSKAVSKGRKRGRQYFVDKAVDKHSDDYGYGAIPEDVNAHDDVEIWCNNCEEYFTKKLSKHLQGWGCTLCSGNSRGESVVEKWLRSNQIEFKKQKSFKECRNKKRLRFDFYIPAHNLIIEYDGKQHFIEEQFPGDNFENTQRRDAIKNQYCFDNGIGLLRIAYWDFDNIETILESHLL